MARKRKFGNDIVLKLRVNSAWKCGCLERKIVVFLRRQLDWRATVARIYTEFSTVGERKQLYDSIRRLRDRRIVVLFPC